MSKCIINFPSTTEKRDAYHKAASLLNTTITAIMREALEEAIILSKKKVAEEVIS